jgi:type IV pilus assembly protein PilA
MTSIRQVVLFVACALTARASALSQSGEEQALKDMFFAKTAAEVEAHLPDAVVKAARELPSADQAAFASQLLIRKEFCDHAKCSTPEDGHALLVVEPNEKEGAAVFEIRLKRKISDGNQSVLLLEGGEPGASEPQRGGVAIWMQLEGGVWRVNEVQVSQDAVVFDESFAKKMKHGRVDASEASAVGSMRTLNTALVTYASTYPEIGFASSIAALGGEGGDPNRSGLIDAVLASGEKSGYRFVYERTSAETYSIVARPVTFGQTGMRSFFTDQSGVIRFTPEDRPPTASDPPLQ